MNSTTIRVTGLVALAVLISVAAVHGAGSDAAQAKQDIANFARSESSQSAAPEAPRPTASESTQLLPNGDFEQGSVVWTEFSQRGFYVITDTTNPYLPVLPHGGNWLAWLGGACDDPEPPGDDCEEVSYVEQEVTVPTGTTNLTFWYWLASNDACGFDFCWLKVDGVIVEEYDLCTDSDTDTWVLREVDFSAYVGETVTVRFQADTDGSLNSNFFLDDVSFDILPIFGDGFESGDTSAWSITTP